MKCLEDNRFDWYDSLYCQYRYLGPSLPAFEALYKDKTWISYVIDYTESARRAARRWEASTGATVLQIRVRLKMQNLWFDNSVTRLACQPVLGL